MVVDMQQGFQGGHAFGEFQRLVIEQRRPQVPGNPDAQETHREHPGDHRPCVQLVAGQQGVGRDRRHQPTGNNRSGGRGDGLVDIALMQRPRQLLGRALGQALPDRIPHQQGNDRHVERPTDLQPGVHVRRGQQDTEHGAGDDRAQAQFALDGGVKGHG